MKSGFFRGMLESPHLGDSKEGSLESPITFDSRTGIVPEDFKSLLKVISIRCEIALTVVRDLKLSLSETL